MKKKTTITFLAAGLLVVSGLKAQTVQEGVNHLYADRFQSAIGVFEKLLATNPNNIDATYWLGQTYFDMDDNAKARQVYDKALASNGSAPLILVGLGHADLHDNKTNDARQKFEAALTASRGKKGDDPGVLTAIGRANVDAKAGDATYALQKLTEAASKDPKNTETLLQLGNAHRKSNPGQGGGQAFETYNKALAVNPAFAVASLRLAKIFESQKNWDFFLNNLNDAVKRDPKFAPAYYELFYYYFYRAKFPEAEAQLRQYIANSDADIQNDFLFAQLCWARKDFPCAITKAEGVIRVMGEKTKPRVYRLLADANFQKGDYTNARKYSDEFFAKKKNVEEIILPDYEIKADVLAKTNGTPDDIKNAYVAGIALDTTVEAKIDFLKKGVKILKEMKARDKEADLIQKMIEIKPKPTINDYFDLATAQYFSDQNEQSRNTAIQMIGLFPDQIYGYEWAYNNSISVVTDTTRSEAFRDSLKLLWAGPDALKMFEFAQGDTTKFKKQYLNAVRYLAQFYINMKKDKEKSLEFFDKWLQADPGNATAIQQYIDQVKKMNIKPATTSPNGNSAPTKSTPASKTNTPKPSPGVNAKTTSTVKAVG